MTKHDKAPREQSRGSRSGRRPGNNSRGAVYDAGRTILLVTCRGKTEITECKIRAVYCSQSIGRQDRNDSIKTRNEKEKEKKP